jgi:alanine racemase
MRRIEIDLGAIKHNYLELKKRLPGKELMAVVKANAYGHGMHEVAAALEAIGVDALATADLDEALELRAAGIKSRLMCWLVLPTDDFALAKELDIEIGVSNFEVLEALDADHKIHLKVDTGLGRNGFVKKDWDRAFELAAKDQVVGIFHSPCEHLALRRLEAAKQVRRGSCTCQDLWDRWFSDSHRSLGSSP